MNKKFILLLVISLFAIQTYAMDNEDKELVEKMGNLEVSDDDSNEEIFGKCVKHYEFLERAELQYRGTPKAEQISAALDNIVKIFKKLRKDIGSSFDLRKKIHKYLGGICD